MWAGTEDAKIMGPRAEVRPRCHRFCCEVKPGRVSDSSTLKKIVLSNWIPAFPVRVNQQHFQFRCFHFWWNFLGKSFSALWSMDAALEPLSTLACFSHFLRIVINMMLHVHETIGLIRDGLESCCWSLLHSDILCFWADSLQSSRMWFCTSDWRFFLLLFYSAILTISTEVM